MAHAAAKLSELQICASALSNLVQHYVLSDFAKSDRGWVDALIAILADNAEFIARGQDASFQNKVHLAMVAKGFGQPEPDDQTGDNNSK